MEATDSFKSVITKHLQAVAANDPLFAETLKKPEKNIKDCVTYILNQVKASGKLGFADDEIFNMAIHYYDEDEISIGKPIQAKVVVNHSVAAPETAAAPVPTPTTARPKAASAKEGKKPEPMTQESLF